MSSSDHLGGLSVPQSAVLGGHVGQVLVSLLAPVHRGGPVCPCCIYVPNDGPG